MSRKVSLAPPPNLEDMPDLDFWLKSLYQRVGEGGTLTKGLSLAELATIPANRSASNLLTNGFSTIYYIWDANATGTAPDPVTYTPTLVFSNGTDWIDINTFVAVV